ncbi:hypothetical protein ONZ45_g3437 [Pleurotus djamor]|nr:hypothetical protein ONZ45_g3437 [Pleurotus djamor]
MFTGLFGRRDAPPPYQGVHVPPLASPFKYNKELSSGSQNVFPPKRPYRHERRTSLLIPPPPIVPRTTPSPSAAAPLPQSAPGCGIDASSSFPSVPKTPFNRFPIASSPPPAPKRSRSRRVNRDEIDAIYDTYDYLLKIPNEYPSLTLPVASEPRQREVTVAALLDTAFRKSAGRIHAELSHLRDICAKVMASKHVIMQDLTTVVQPVPDDYPPSPSSLGSQDIIMTQTDLPVKLESSPEVPIIQTTLPTPATVYYSLPPSPTFSPMHELGDPPVNPADTVSPDQPACLLEDGLAFRSTKLSPILLLDLTSLPVVNEVTPSATPALSSVSRGTKRKRDALSIEAITPDPKRLSIRPPSPLNPRTLAADEMEVGRYLVADMDYPRPGCPTSTTPWIDYLSQACRTGPNRVADSVFLLD